MNANIKDLDERGCYLCDILRNGVGHPYKTLFPQSELRTEIIAESEHFVAVLDIGPIVEGYTLVFTRAHEVAFSEIPERATGELERFVDDLALTLKIAYGITPQVFEHGSTGPSSARGCCVEHAHLHIVPFNGRLIPDSDESYFQEIKGLHELRSIRGGTDYLYLRDSQRHHWIWETNAAPQQYFRRLLSRAVGEDLWNWKDYILLCEATNTRSRLLRAYERLLPILSQQG